MSYSDIIKAQPCKPVIENKLTLLFKPEFRNSAHRTLAEKQAAVKVNSAVNRWLMGTT